MASATVTWLRRLARSRADTPSAFAGRLESLGMGHSAAALLIDTVEAALVALAVVWTGFLLRLILPPCGETLYFLWVIRAFGAIQFGLRSLLGLVSFLDLG